MSGHSAAALAGDVLLVLSAVFLASFMVLYHYFMDWEKNPGGRHIMRSSLALLSLLILLVLVLPFFDVPYWVYVYLRALVFLALCGVSVERVVLLVRSRRRNNDKEIDRAGTFDV